MWQISMWKNRIDVRFYYFLLLLFLATGGIVAGCDFGGEDDNRISAREARNMLQIESKSLSNAIERGLEDGKFGVFVEDLFGDVQVNGTDLIADLNSAFAGGGWTKSRAHAFLRNRSLENVSRQSHGFLLVDRLGEKKIFKTDPEGRFDYQASKAKWVWESSNEEWVEEESSDDLVLAFPTDSVDGTNNAEFRISSFSDKEVTAGDTTGYVPTSIETSISVEGEEVFSVDLGGTNSEKATYDAGNAIDVAVSIFTAPLLSTFDFQSQIGEQRLFKYALTDKANSINLVRNRVNLALTGKPGDTSGQQTVDLATGTFSLGSNIDIKYRVDVDDLNSLGEDPRPSRVNEEIEMADILIDQTQAARLEYGTRTNQKGEEVGTFFVVYNDGSRDPISEVFEGLIEMEDGAAGQSLLNAMPQGAIAPDPSAGFLRP